MDERTVDEFVVHVLGQCPKCATIIGTQLDLISHVRSRVPYLSIRLKIEKIHYWTKCKINLKNDNFPGFFSDNVL